MALSFGLSPWLLVLSALAAGALSVWLYRRTTPDLSRGKRIALGLLRFSALFLILFLLLQPVLRLVDREEKRPVVAVLVDDSESLRITASGDTSAASVRSGIERLLSALPADVHEADVQIFRFGSDLDVASPGSFTTDSLRFEAGRTDISQALESLRDRLRDENLRAAVLLSDGQYNTGRNPLYASERYPVPIFTAVLGDTSRHFDVQIRRVTTNQIAYVGTELPVQVGVRTEDMERREVTVSLARDDSVVSSTRVTLPEGSSEVTVDLSVLPETEGLQRYTVAVTEIPGEATHRNNRESVAVRVLENRRRVLLVGGAPGPDVASIRQLIGTDPTFELSPFVQKDALTFYEGAFPSSLEEFDLILVAGYPGRVADEGIMQRIADAAEGGAPTFFLLTGDTDIQLLDEHFSDVLPVTADLIRGGSVEASLVPTPAGAGHPILNIAESSAEAWRRFPPLAYTQARWMPSPDARVLATTSVRGVELDDPIFVIRRRNLYRTAALLGAGTWRWRNVPDDLSDLEHLWPGLFSNTVQWLTAREDDRPVRITPARDVFGGGEIVQLSGQAYDESLNPVPNASMEVEVVAPDGSVYPYLMDPIGNGRYTLDAGTLPEGTYEFEAVGTLNTDTLGTDSGTFAVGSLTLEYRETRANAVLMRQIAQRSGGEMLDPARPDLLTSSFSSSANLASLVVEHETEMELRRRSIFLVLIVLLLTAEWFLRKRSGMV